MKALFISNDPKIFDPESAVRARMRSYAEAIGTLHIISRGPSEAEAVTREELSEGRVLVLHRLIATKASMLLKAPKQIRKLILQEEIEIVSAQDPFEYGWIAQEAVKGTNAKLHIQVHTDFLSPYFDKGSSRMAFLNRARRILAERVLPSAQGIRVVSVRIKNRMLAHFGTSIVKPVVIPIPIQDVPVTEAVPFPSSAFFFSILAVGRLEDEKRFQDCIRALTGVHTLHPDAGLFIVGEGRKRTSLQKLAKELGVEDHVVFLGQRADVAGLMRSADLFIQASSYEGYGLTLLEASLAGLPIITTDVGVVGEVLEKGKDVVVVPIANPSAMAHEVVNLIETPERRVALGQSAQRVVQEYLKVQSTSPADIARNLEEVVGVAKIT